MGGMEASASPIMLPAPPPRPSPVQRSGGGGGESLVVPRTPSVRAISQKKRRSWGARPRAPPPRVVLPPRAQASGEGVGGGLAALPAP